MSAADADQLAAAERDARGLLDAIPTRPGSSSGEAPVPDLPAPFAALYDRACEAEPCEHLFAVPAQVHHWSGVLPEHLSCAACASALITVWELEQEFRPRPGRCDLCDGPLGPAYTTARIAVRVLLICAFLCRRCCPPDATR